VHEARRRMDLCNIETKETMYGMLFFKHNEPNACVNMSIVVIKNLESYRKLHNIFLHHRFFVLTFANNVLRCR
jgi:hypothetical protein